MKLRPTLLLVFVLLSATVAQAQFERSLYLKPVSITDLPGVQSYAVAEFEGKWLIVGGRTDGLHQRQPFASFLSSQNNRQLMVIDPLQQQFWSASVASLPDSIADQLSSTNMSFQQVGDYLYCVGGYGYSNDAADHITYDRLLAIQVENLMDAIIQGNAIAPHIRQFNYPELAVAGGQLHLIDTVFHLLGGQKFTGRYNPMGPDHGPGFEQEYTNAIRRFTLVDDGTDIALNFLAPWTDVDVLHRRDYNAEPQIMPNGQQGITMFSGVFTDPGDLPYLDCVNVEQAGFSLNDTFSQYYNHYHCATAPIYDSVEQTMHTLFFGGISQFYEEDGQLVQDDDVPFVNTIARVTRSPSGLMQEYKMEQEMPGLLGAGSEFILAPDVPRYSNGVVRWNDLDGDSILLGYIYGGIESSAPNIFFVNTGVQSEASANIFAVYLVDDQSVSIGTLNPSSVGGFQMQVRPNPSTRQFTLEYQLHDQESLYLEVTDQHGRLLYEEALQSQVGRNVHQITLSESVAASAYLLTIRGEDRKQSMWLRVE